MHKIEPNARRDTRRHSAEWGAWLASFGILPFFALGGGVSIVTLTALTWKRCWAQLRANHDIRCLLLWLAIIAASIISARSPLDAFLGAFNFVPLVLVFGAMTVTLRDPQRLRQLAQTLVFPAILLCAIGMAELYAGAMLTEDLRIASFDLAFVSGGHPPGRMSSLFLHANALANYAAVLLALLFGLICEALDRRASRTYWLLLAISAISVLTMLLLASSRNAWGVAFLVTVAFVIYRHWWSILAAIGGALTAIATAAFAPDDIATTFRTIVPYAIWGRLSDRMYPDRPIASLRVSQWHYSLEMTADRPFLGWGLRSFSPLYEAHSDFFVGHPHNLYLMLAAETGTIATLVLLFAVGSIVTRSAIDLCQQRETDATLWTFTYLVAFLATSAYHLLDVTLFNLPVNLLGWALLAGLAGTSSSKKRKPQDA